MGWSSSKTSSGGGGGGSVNSVTGLNTDNTDPANPVVAIAVNTTLTGAGTPLSPLGVDSNLLLSINPSTPYIPVKTGTNSFGDSPFYYSAIDGLLKTVFSLQDRGLKIDFLNNIYQLLDANSKKSVDWLNREISDATEIISINYQIRQLLDNATAPSIDWRNRLLIENNGLLTALSFACVLEKTESQYYQNDFLARLGSQGRIIDNAVLGELWWSGHTIEVTNQPSPLTPIGAVLVCKGHIWQVADFSTLDAVNLTGIYLGGNKVLLDGHIVVTQTGVTTNFPIVDGQISASIGTPIYGDPLSAGNMTITPPTTSLSISRRLGHTYYEDGINVGYFLMLFRPSNDWTIVP